jgi:hypothetical protein
MLKSTYQKLIPAVIRYHLYQFRQNPALKLYQGVLPLLDTNVAQLSTRLQSLHNSHQGEHCFIFGNGPSLNKMDLSLFKGQHVWASNRFYLIFDQIDWRPDFYVGIDKRVIPDIANELAHLQEELNHTKFFFPLIFREQRNLKSSANTFWFRENQNEKPGNEEMDFSQHCAEVLAPSKTVTISMIQLAVYLGFNPIYLVGCDTSYTVPPTVISEDEKNEYLVSTQNDDPNHFHPGYFGAGKKWHQPHVERMLDQYEKIKLITDEMGIEIINATVGGNLEIFPRIDYQTALSRHR